MSDLFVGIDVSKARLDVCLLGDPKLHQFANSPEGVAALVACLRHAEPTLVVLESTGGYDDLALRERLVASIPTARITPRFARDFSRALGKRAKTDRLDAQLLALRFTQIAVAPAPRACRIARTSTSTSSFNVGNRCRP